MDAKAIAAAAIGAAGLGTLGADLGRTRLAELLRAPGEGRTDEVEGQEAARPGGSAAAQATRP